MQFSNKATNYNKYATFQDKIAKNLVDNLTVSKKTRILDLGCGTGFVAKHLQEIKNVSPLQIWQIDLSPEMCKIAFKYSPNTMPMNMELTSFKNASFDIITSSMSLQWTKVPKTLAEVHRLLKPNGRFYCAVPVDESFQEIRRFFEELQIPYPILQMPKSNIFDKFNGSVETFDIEVPNILGFFRDFNKIGASSGIKINQTDLRRISKSSPPTKTCWQIYLGYCEKDRLIF